MDEMVEVKNMALTWAERAKTVTITDPESLLDADFMSQGIRNLRKRIAELFDPLIAKAHEAHKAIIAARKETEAPLIEAEAVLNPKIASYLAEQEKIRRAEEARLREEARKVAEEAALEAAAELEANGMPEAAQAVLESPVIVPKVKVEAPKLEGTHTREEWSAKVYDFMALVKAVAVGQAPAIMLIPNQTALNQQARSLRGEMRIPGVRAEKQIILVRK